MKKILQQPKRRNKSLTKEIILNTAENIFAKDGYHKTSMDKIAEKSGTSKGSIYFHFPSKENLFCSLIDKLTNSLEQATIKKINQKTNIVNQINTPLNTLFDLISKHKNLTKLVLTSSNISSPIINEHIFNIHERFANFIKINLDKAIKDHSITPINTKITAYAWLGAINEIIINWIHNDKNIPLETTLPELRNLLLRSIGLVP
tara:strand:- start:869 stop:1480 length:612 start_codon:yes stop_codon:yes gene_type:complete